MRLDMRNSTAVLARVLVRYYHVASFIVNANHGAMFG